MAMKIITLAAFAVLMRAEARPIHQCDPYATICPACKDCSRCVACSKQHNRCSICRWR